MAFSKMSLGTVQHFGRVPGHFLVPKYEFVIGFEAGRRHGLKSFILCVGKHELKSADNLAGNLALHGEQVLGCQFAVVGLPHR